MAITWEEASQSVLSLATELVREFHTELIHANILFIHRSEAANSGGRTVLGKAAKISAPMKVLLDDADFLIWISKKDWEAASEGFRRPLLDHLLEHCTTDINDDEYVLRNPEINEFRSIIDRHGLWSLDLLRVGETIKHYQDKLPGMKPDITLSSGGRSFTMSSDQFEKVANMPLAGAK